MDLIDTIIVFGFLEIQNNNVPVDDKPYQYILNQINKTYTCTCLGYEFCFEQHDNVTRQSYFFQSLIHLPQTKQNPITPDVTVYIYIMYINIGNRKKNTLSSRQACFVIAHSSGILKISLTLHKNSTLFHPTKRSVFQR